MKKPKSKRAKAEPKQPKLERVRGGHAEGSIGSLQASQTWDDDWLAPV